MNLNILKHDHFKLYVLIEDTITFETELQKKGIEFYSNAEELIGSGYSIRYYLKDEDRLVIDRIIKENDISSGIESSSLNRFVYNRKPLKLFIILVIIVTLIFSILTFLY